MRLIPINDWRTVQIERIGGAAIITLTAEGKQPQRSAAPVRDIRSAVEMVVRWIASEVSEIEEIKCLADIHAIGHRVVHGGEKFTESAFITDEVLRGIEDCIELAPLHNPANIKGIIRRPRNFRLRLAASRGFRHGVSPDLARTRFSLRLAISTLSPPQNSPLRFSRHVASLRRLSLPQDQRNAARRSEYHYSCISATAVPSRR